MKNAGNYKVATLIALVLSFLALEYRFSVIAGESVIRLEQCQRANGYLLQALEKQSE